MEDLAFECIGLGLMERGSGLGNLRVRVPGEGFNSFKWGVGRAIRVQVGFGESDQVQVGFGESDQGSSGVWGERSGFKWGLGTAIRVKWGLGRAIRVQVGFGVLG